MRDYQKNAVMNHSDAMKDLAGSFDEGIFVDGAIGDNRSSVIVECLSKQSDSMGGYLVPDSMEKKIIHSLKANNVIRRLATVIRTDGSDRHIPLAATMSDAQWLGENATIQLAEASFSSVRFKQHKLGMMIQVSNELIKDGGVDLSAFLAEAFAEQIASAEENAFINGNGVRAFWPAAAQESALPRRRRMRLRRRKSFLCTIRWTRSIVRMLFS